MKNAFEKNQQLQKSQNRTNSTFYPIIRRHFSTGIELKRSRGLKPRLGTSFNPKTRKFHEKKMSPISPLRVPVDIMYHGESFLNVPGSENLQES